MKPAGLPTCCIPLLSWLDSGAISYHNMAMPMQLTASHGTNYSHYKFILSIEPPTGLLQYVLSHSCRSFIDSVFHRAYGHLYCTYLDGRLFGYCLTLSF